MSPCRDWIVSERVIHPLAHLVGHDGDVWNWTHKNIARVKIYMSECLHAARPVEAEDAACGTGSQLCAARSFALDDVVDEKDRKSTGINALGSEPRKAIHEIRCQDS